jgi:hypothetical protein
MRLASLIVLAGVTLLGRSGCKAPTNPTPSPSPTPSSFPRGVPNATALENLALIETLERAQGRQTTRLVWVSTQVNLDGRGGAWRYQFGEIVEGRASLYEWNVSTDGTVQHLGRVTELVRVEYGELRPLTIDSPEMARLGLEYGGQRFIDRYPTVRTVVSVIYRHLGGKPVCNLVFRAEPDVECIVPIYIDAQTGALMARDLSCLSK